MRCTMYIHTSRRSDTKCLDKYSFSNSHTRSLYKWPSHRLTDSLTHSSLLQSVTLTLRTHQTHWQIDTATNTVMCSLIDQLGLVNDRLTTNWVSDCLFDSIPYNKLYEWIRRLFFLLLTLPSSLRGYIVTAPSSLGTIGRTFLRRLLHKDKTWEEMDLRPEILEQLGVLLE